MGSIYKATDTVQKKSYIGCSRYDAKKTKMRNHFRGRGNKHIKKANGSMIDFQTSLNLQFGSGHVDGDGTSVIHQDTTL